MSNTEQSKSGDSRVTPPFILGVCLIKNEQNFIAWSLMNAIEFCDEILVLDNMSEDGTLDIVARIANLYGKVRVVQVRDCNDTHRYVEEYAGTPTWILKIDGDEVLDPGGLRILRKEIRSGIYDGYWKMLSPRLNVAGLDFKRKTAFGFNVKKHGTALFNFNALVSWHESEKERLDGTNCVFRPEFSDRPVLREELWDQSRFRALHFCFFPRSPLDRDWRPKLLDGRSNPVEVHKKRTRMRRRLFGWYYRRRLGYKATRYVGQTIDVVDVSSFGIPADFRNVDPDCDRLMETIQVVTDARRFLTKTA